MFKLGQEYPSKILMTGYETPGALVGNIW